LLTRIVEQPLRDIFPDCLPAIEANGIHSLDFYDPLAATAGDAQHMTLDFRQLSLSHLDAVDGAGIRKQRIPVFVRKGASRAATGAAGRRSAWAASFSICFLVGMRQLAGRSVMSD
jgi:hypothetical protein